MFLNGFNFVCLLCLILNGVLQMIGSLSARKEVLVFSISD